MWAFRTPRAGCFLILTLLASDALLARETGRSLDRVLPCVADFVPSPSSFDFLDDEFLDGASNVQVPVRSTIGRIHFTRLNIFDESDPRENRWLYRWANRIHALTRQGTLQQQILFRPGDIYEPRVLDESARILRANKFLFDAVIVPVSACKGSVDIEVVSRDTWSFTPEVSLRRSGGESTVRYSLRDTNIFGSGKEIMIAGKSDVDRDSSEIAYRDPNLFGSRKTARIHLVDSDDGSSQFARLQLPFFALDSKRSWRISAQKEDLEDTQYFNANKVSELRHERTVYLGSVGFSRGLHDGYARRWHFGYRFEDHQYGVVGEKLPPPLEFPVDRRLSYPFISYESVEDNYGAGLNLDQIHRTEDLHLGRRVVTSLGYSTTGQKRMLLSGRVSDTLKFDTRTFLQHRINWQGQWNFDTSSSEEVQVSYRLRYQRVQTRKRALYASFDSTYVRNLSPEKQLQLGGDSGLRGYPQRYATGDRSIQVTVEQRMYTDAHWLQLVRVGWAVFFDAGKVWFSGEDNGAGNRILKNVGFGLRLTSSKAELGRVLHLDVAYPVDRRDDPEVEDVQYLVTIKNTF